MVTAADAELEAARAFMIADSGVLPRAIGIVADRTVERMTLEGAAVFRYAISKHMLMMSPEDDCLLLEIRVDEDDGGRRLGDL